MQVIVGTYIVLGVLLLGLMLQHLWTKVRSLAANLLISYFTILIVVVAAEGYFRFFFAEASASPLSLQRWIEIHFHTNAEGYRDREWQPSDFVDKEVVVVVGDSFTAGIGIDNPDDRYSAVLADLLGDDYAVVNRGIFGSSTPVQLEGLQSFDLAAPDVVIWQYLINDIEYAGLRVGSMPPSVNIPPIAQQSYLLNYIAYSYIAPRVDYWGWQYQQYDNHVVWQLHEAEIQAMVDYVDSIGAELIVVIYPNMLDPVTSIPYVDRVAQVIEASGQTQIMKLFDAVAAWSPDVPLVVSKYDSHASVEFNHYLAQRIYDEYFSD